MKYFNLIIGVALVGCATPTPPHTVIDKEAGSHQLPYQPNKRFILESIVEEPYQWTDSPLTIVYFLDGKRQQFRLTGKGTGNGYITDAGRILNNEIPGVESPIMDERVIQLSSGEEITIFGNTVSKDEVRLHPTKPPN